MSFCPYCKEIVGNGVTECPSCGMSWAAAEQAPPAPRIVSEQPLPSQQPAYQAPPQQPAYQQPPQQPQYQQPPPQQYQQPPPQPQYQQPPPQQYQQPPPQQYQPQPQYRQAPPQQYQQPYQQPYAPPRPRKKAGMGSMILAMMGGIGAIIASFAFFLIATPNNTEFQTLWDLLDNAPDEYLYAWLIPVFGILAIVLALIGFATQSKGAGYLTGLLGIIVLILPVIFAFHLATDFEVPIQEIFFSSADTTMAEGAWQMFLGGFMAMSAGLMMIGGGFGLARRIGRIRHPAQSQQYR